MRFIRRIAPMLILSLVVACVSLQPASTPSGTAPTLTPGEQSSTSSLAPTTSATTPAVPSATATLASTPPATATPTATATTTPQTPATPTAIATTTPRTTATPTATGTATPPAFQPRWTEIGSIEAPTFEGLELLGFDGGYVAYLEFYSSSAWFSTDGAQWQPVDLPLDEAPCVDDEQGIGYLVEVGASRATSIILLGTASVPQPGSDNCTQQTISLTSADGQTWQRSEPFGVLRDQLDIDLAAVWPTPTGWQAAIGDGNERTGIWDSADGLSWTQTEDLEGVGNVTGAADTQGRAILSLYNRLGSSGPLGLAQARLVASDGQAWSDLAGPFTTGPDAGVIFEIAPPSAQLAVWTLWAQDLSDRSKTTIWTSADLVDWQSHGRRDFPYTNLTSTSAGLIGTRSLPRGSGHYMTQDGIDWIPVAPDIGLAGVTDGPAGVLGIAGTGGVYRLEQ